MGTLNGQVERLVAAEQRLAGARSRLGSGPIEARPARAESNTEHDWDAGEVLAHVAEFVPYWLGEVERVLAGPSEPVPFGRVATDQVRISIVDRDRTLPYRELFDRISSSVERAGRRLRELDEADAGRRGLHPARGEMTVSDIVDRFMVAHLEEHADQLAEAASKG